MTANDGSDGSPVLRWAGATDVGRVRSNNQDQYMLRPEARLWVVADGMGGHRGGEVASDLACKEMARTYHDRTVDSLVRAVSAANRVVHETGNADPDLRGMGTTMVALAVVAADESDDTAGTLPGDEVLAVANVGDSRAYRLSAGELEQLTEDHSLVADMVREGQLAPEEAETHPQKNILTRVLGVYDEIPVDIVTVTPHVGDRYLLCSDGLFNEVSESEIAAVLRRLDDPDDAADELVRLSLASGARDNTTVVIVDVMATGQGHGQDGNLGAATLASTGGTGPVGGGGTGQPGPATQPIGVITAEPTAGSPATAATATTVDLAERPDELAAEAGLTDDDAGRGGRRSRRGEAKQNGNGDPEPKPKRFTWRVALFCLLLVALLGGVVATIQWYAKAVYHVGFEDDHVAVFHGRPGGVLWINSELVDESALERADVEPVPSAQIETGREFSTQDEAEAFVDGLIDDATVYSVGFDEDAEAVAVLVTRPGAEPEVVQQSELTREDLTNEERADLDNGRSFENQDDALKHVARLETAADERATAEARDKDGAAGQAAPAAGGEEQTDP